ncbi:MAG: hypothetical protein R6V39_00605, partial [Desulfovibrionales bacterium]
MKKAEIATPAGGTIISNESSLEYLNDRIDYLDRLNKNALEAMENVARLGDFKDSFSKISSVDVILKKISEGCSDTLPLISSYIFLID